MAESTADKYHETCELVRQVYADFAALPSEAWDEDMEAAFHEFDTGVGRHIKRMDKISANFGKRQL